MMAMRRDDRETTILRRAAGRLDAIRERAHDMHGRSRLVPYETPPSRRPRVSQIRFINEAGGFVDYGSGQRGADVADLIAWLAQSDRKSALVWLERTLEDLP